MKHYETAQSMGWWLSSWLFYDVIILAIYG